jgi:hypothetical protein
MYLELLEKKALNKSDCLSFDFDALRSLPQGSSLQKYFENIKSLLDILMCTFFLKTNLKTYRRCNYDAK